MLIWWQYLWMWILLKPSCRTAVICSSCWAWRWLAREPGETLGSHNDQRGMHGGSDVTGRKGDTGQQDRLCAQNIFLLVQACLHRYPATTLRIATAGGFLHSLLYPQLPRTILTFYGITIFPEHHYNSTVLAGPYTIKNLFASNFPYNLTARQRVGGIAVLHGERELLNFSNNRW